MALLVVASELKGKQIKLGDRIANEKHVITTSSRAENSKHRK